MRLGFDTGTTPDKWARAWRERRREPLALVPVEGAVAGETGLRDGSLDMCLVRLPLASTDGLHLVRLYDIVEGLRDMAAGAMDSYLSVTSNRTNEIMRTLTVVNVLFMPLTFLTGFFGMNFFGEAYNIPDPFWPTTLFWMCMAVIAVTPPMMIWWMANKGWLRSLTKDEEEDEPAHNYEFKSEEP